MLDNYVNTRISTLKQENEYLKNKLAEVTKCIKEYDKGWHTSYGCFDTDVIYNIINKQIGD